MTVLTVVALLRGYRRAPFSRNSKWTGEQPLVSILVPARNEAGRILAGCVASILGADYGRFEVIAVDDHSTDATLEQLRTLASGDERLRVIAGTEPPLGWLGKTWALHQAVGQSHGEWVLATDADMMFTSQALSTALTYARDTGCDALTLIPRLDTFGFWDRVFIPTWGWRLLLRFMFGGWNDPNARGAKALGGFFLIRRAVLDQVGGYAGVRGEVAEDVRLAEVMKRKGVRLRIEYAFDLIGTRMYSDFSDLWESCSRNWFALLDFSLLSSIGLVLVTFLVAVLPPACAFVWTAHALSSGALPQNVLYFLLVSVWLMQVMLIALVNRWHKIRAVYALATPLGFLLQCVLICNSMWSIKFGKGVTWRGRRIYESV